MSICKFFKNDYFQAKFTIFEDKENVGENITFYGIGYPIAHSSPKRLHDVTTLLCGNDESITNDDQTEEQDSKYA